MLHPGSTKVWDRDMKTGKLKKRLYKGVPDAVRGEVWSRLLLIKKTKEEQVGKYEVISVTFHLTSFSIQNCLFFWVGNATAGSFVVTGSPPD